MSALGVTTGTRSGIYVHGFHVVLLFPRGSSTVLQEFHCRQIEQGASPRMWTSGSEGPEAVRFPARPSAQGARRKGAVTAGTLRASQIQRNLTRAGHDTDN